MIVASLLIGFTVAFLTDVTRRGPDLTGRRIIWVLAAVVWFAIIHWSAEASADLGNAALAYAGGALVGLLWREYRRAGSS